MTDWMQGWGNILGVLLSSIAVIFTGLLFRHERKIHREERADAEAAQARLVFAQVLAWHGDSNREDEPITTIAWQLKNYSSAPIFDLVVHIGPWTDANFDEAFEGDERGTVECNPPLVLDPDDPFDPRHYVVKIEFTDAAGLYWERTIGEPPQRVIIPPRKSESRRPWTRLFRRKARRKKTETEAIPF